MNKTGMKSIKDFVACNWYSDSIKTVKRSRILGIVILTFVLLIVLWVEENHKSYIIGIISIILLWSCIIIGFLIEKKIKKVFTIKFTETEFLVSRITHEMILCIALVFIFLYIILFGIDVSSFIMSIGIIIIMLAIFIFTAIKAMNIFTTNNIDDPIIGERIWEILDNYMSLMQDGRKKSVTVIALMGLSSYINPLFLIVLLSVVIGLCFPYYFIIAFQLILAKKYGLESCLPQKAINDIE